MDRESDNGGFPLPAAALPSRVLRARHDGCGAETRLRLPAPVPAHAVRRVVCERCTETFEPGRVREARGRASAWRWASMPVAAAAVVGGLLLVQGEEAPGPAEPAGRAAAAGAAAPAAKQGAQPPAEGRLISESSFQLALPAGWERATPASGATFAAAAPGGEADATLWIERDGKLDFASFEARSLAQLESLAGSAAVVARRPGPTPETSSVRIAPTSAPSGAPHYEALLATSGNRWYYLATTVQPDASRDARRGVELVRSSFLPLGGR